MFNSIFVQAVSLAIIALMFALFFSPINISSLYIICRPLIQPFAYQKYTILGSMPITGVVAVLLIVSAYLNCFIKRDNTLRHAHLIPLYLTLYFSILSFFNTPSFTASLAGLLKIFTAIAMYILVYNSIKSGKDVKKILWSFITCTVIPMGYGFYQYFTGTGHAWKADYYAGKRIDSFLGEWNAYGEFLCIAIVAATMLLLRESDRKLRAVLYAILGFMVTSLILSLNRGSWVSLLLGIFIASIVYREHVSFKKLVVVGLIIGTLFGGVIYQRFSELGQKSEYRTSNTLAGRMQYWVDLWPIAMEKPVIGHGIGASEIIGEQNFRFGAAPHNDYLRLMLEIGFIGMLGYLIFLMIQLVYFLRPSARRSEWTINYPILIMLIYIGVLSIFQNIIYNVTIFPMFLGLLAIGHKADYGLRTSME